MSDEPSTAEAGELLTISFLRLLQHHRVRVVIHAQRIGSDDHDLLAEGLFLSLGTAMNATIEQLNAWVNYGYLGVQSEVMRSHTIWTQQAEPQSDA